MIIYVTMFAIHTGTVVEAALGATGQRHFLRNVWISDKVLKNKEKFKYSHCAPCVESDIYIYSSRSVEIKQTVPSSTSLQGGGSTVHRDQIYLDNQTILWPFSSETSYISV